VIKMTDSEISEIGYHEDPANGDGITRARTTRQIRSWDIPRTTHALESLNSELGKIDFPGNYILFEGKGNKKVYIGEAKNIYNRLKTHMHSPKDEVKNWTKALIINDGRIATQSEFNDTVVRKALEYYFIKLFKANKYTVVSQGEPQNLNTTQKFVFNSLQDELNFFLLKKNIISKVLEKTGQLEVHLDELKKILARCGKPIQEIDSQKKVAIIDGQKVFYRSGSDKPKGWQITFRDLSKSALQSGEGFLLVSRGPILLIPMTEIQKVIGGAEEYNKNTIDVFILFEEDTIALRYKQNTLDVTNFKLPSSKSN